MYWAYMAAGLLTVASCPLPLAVQAHAATANAVATQRLDVAVGAFVWLNGLLGRSLVLELHNARRASEGAPALPMPLAPGAVHRMFDSLRSGAVGCPLDLYVPSRHVFTL